MLLVVNKLRLECRIINYGMEFVIPDSPNRDLEYILQFCDALSVIWKDIGHYSTNSFIKYFKSFKAGDKLRCIVKKHGITRYYTNSITFTENVIFDSGVDLSSDLNKSVGYQVSDPTVMNYYNLDSDIKTKFIKTDYLLTEISDFDFAKYCADLYRKNNYCNVDVVRECNESGIVITAEKDKNSYVIKCICSSDNVDDKFIKKALEAKNYFHCEKVIVLTNAFFTSDVKRFATENNVILSDRSDFLKLHLYDESNSSKEKTSAKGKKDKEIVINEERKEIIVSVANRYSFFSECSSIREIKELRRKRINSSLESDAKKEVKRQYERLIKELEKALVEYEQRKL